MDFAVVTSLLGIVEQHLLQKPLHPCLINHTEDNHTQIILSLKDKLIFLQTYLQQSERKTDPEEQKRVLSEEIRDVAREAEDKIESKLSEVYLAADQGDHAAVEAACEDLHQTLQQVVKDFESVEVSITDLQITPSLQLENISEPENAMIGLEDEYASSTTSFSAPNVKLALPKKAYDVFLSFRGEDVRKSFVDHLYSAMQRRGIRTFKDNEKLQRGNSIWPALNKAIGESSIAVVIFSEHYADSTWCLEELASIMVCRELKGQMVIPIFYGVDPSTVRKQKGTFGEAFAGHEKRFEKEGEKVKKWREVLVKVSNLAGWDLSTLKGYEAKFVKIFVEDIIAKLGPTRSTDDPKLVGMKPRMQKLYSLLGLESSTMIELKDEFEKIKGMLISNNHEQEVISIVGRGGAGKTTLAQKVYDDPSVLSHFEIRAWITLSQEFSVSKVFLGIMGCIVSLTTEISKADDTEYLSDRLRNILKGQRYLIVIDDIWTTKIWESLQSCFPNNSNGSRIIITTRIMSVAVDASRSDEYIYKIRTLTSEESWDLFVKTLSFNISPELESIGRKVLKIFDGLPLSIAMFAVILANHEMPPEQWKYVAQKINSALMGRESQSASVITALIYNDLPGHLRACFLYLGIFPKGTVICVKKLIKLWMAEGFLMSKIDKSLEEIAQDSLNDLIARRILLVEKWSFDGKVESCRIHDWLHDFCLRKAQEENMLVVSNEYGDDLAETWSETKQSKLGGRWMSWQSRHWPITQSSSLNYSSGKIRSILHFGKDLYLEKCRFGFASLKLLRVLDLSLIKYWSGIPSEIVNLVHLRYLALTTTGSLYNIQLFKFQSLQTLILFSWKEECHLQLPCDILDLPLLRHVHLDKGSSLYLPNSIQGNIQTLFWLKVASWDSKIPDFTRIPNLKELGVYIEGEVSANALNSLDQLHQLEKLKFEMGRVGSFCLPNSFPPSIKKLTLRRTYLPWEEMDIIGKLPNLEVLKLKDFAFRGPKWEPRDVWFYRLKFLLIVHLDLKHWNASANNFPILECLVLRRCYFLKELPSDIACISRLQVIEVIECSPSLVASAKLIQEKMPNYGYDRRRSLIEDELAKDHKSDENSEEEEIDRNFGLHKYNSPVAFVVVTSLLGVVDQNLLQPNPLLNNILDDPQIAVSLSNKLRSLQHFLEESEIQTVDEALGAKIRDIAVEAEAEIESKLGEVYLAFNNGDRGVQAWCGLRQTLQCLVKDIESLEALIKIHKESLPVKELSTAAAVEVESTVISGSSQHNMAFVNEMIGCNDEFQDIRYRLIEKETYHREVIAVMGMGGIGKTTLARRVYEDPKIRSCFHICAWIVVSPQHNVKEILIDLLGCIVSKTTEIYEKDDEELAHLVHKILMGKRYLVVLDDIWNTRAWDDIKRYFPDNMNGSRILMTTQTMEVAAYATSSEAFIFHIPFLNLDESWDLLVREVFKGGVCPPPKIKSIGRKIVKKCKGIPLAILVIAGLLVKLERSPKQWEDFAQNINSNLMEMEPYNHTVSSTIALSYNNLPVHLQACFLYLGIFPKDYDIPVKKLMKLWVAEGFFEPKMHKNLEEVAKNYLDDLIARNLVLVVKRSFDGKVKSCRLHDLVHDFCLREAQEENMLVVSNEYGDDLAGTWLETKQSKLGCRWMSWQSRHWPITRSSSLNYTRGKIHSIFYFDADLYLTDSRIKFPRLELLRVLDLSSIRYRNGMPGEIENLIHLRYLALTTTGSLNSFQMFKLQSLQTLSLLSWKEEETHLQLPCDILDLPSLRHVHLDKVSSLYLPNSIQGNLQTLFGLKVGSWDSKIPDFTRVPNLKELGIYIEGEVSANTLNSLDQLHQLKKLKFEMGRVGKRVERFNLPISFPQSIKKLTFCRTYLPWEEMDVIGKLPNLEVLKLKDFAFCGSKWKPSEGGFQRLKLFLIAHSDLKHWDASSNPFPVLEHLVLKHCWDLVNIPIGFADIFTLKSIELESCYSSLAKSAKEIQEQLQDFGDDLFVVRELGIKEKLSEESESSEEESE